MATDSSGNFVVVWHSDGPGGGGSDTSDDSVQGQRYDSSGSAVGAEFQVNSFTTSDQTYSEVATDSSGNFLVVWRSEGSSSSDSSGLSIQGQRYDSSGNAVGAEFQVNSYTTDTQSDPDVVTGSSFLVVWESRGPGGGGSDTSSRSVQGQRFGGPVPVELLRFSVE